MILLPKRKYLQLLQPQESIKTNLKKKKTHLKLEKIQDTDTSINVSSLSKQSQKRATALLEFIKQKNSQDLNIRNDGTLMFKRQPIGHILDYLRYLVSFVKLKTKPKNVDKVIVILKKNGGTLIFNP